MTCSTCIGRRDVALDLFPRRRPLYVPCGNCKMRRAARWHIAGRVGMALLFVAFMFGPALLHAAHALGWL